MRLKNKFWLLLVIPTLFMIAIIVIMAVLFWQQMTPQQRVLFLGITKEYFIYFFGGAIFLVAGIGLLIDGIINTYVIPVAKVAEETSVIFSVNPGHRIAPIGGRDIHKLIHAINEGAQRYEDLKSSVDEAIRQAKREVEEEKNLLAGLMAELPEGVIVCNREGNILLYNRRVIRLLVEGCTHAAEADVEPFIGLGRSISDIIDEHLISHAIDEILYKLKQKVSPVVSHFVITSCEDALLDVEAAPIVDRQRRFNGFILLIRDITEQLKTDSQVAALLQSLIRSMRASLASIRSAIEAIVEFPDMNERQLENFKRIIHEEAVSLSAILEENANEYAEHIRSRWPLISIRATELADALISRAYQKLGLKVDGDLVEAECWIKVDSYAFILSLLYLLDRLQETVKAKKYSLSIQVEDCLAAIDIAWQGKTIAQQELKKWCRKTICVGREALALTMEELLSHHEAEIWSCPPENGSPGAHIRIALPAADTCRPDQIGGLTILPDSRPEFFDFDLFHQPGQTPDVDSQPLDQLSYTVFDTETTGLDPRGGDEIISIGAVRIINGRILRNERFDQLIDPRRALPPESTRIHGIRPDMLAGQPPIEEVLPRFHQFARDTVLVAHNAAFDMQMLKMKEELTGVKFINPVLDTLLLSAVVHPAQEDHSMEAMAQRLGVNIVGRHTAIGDALSTAELFLKLIPLLFQQGIRTLKEARLASRKTYYARLKY